MLLSTVFVLFGSLFVLALVTGKMFVFNLKDTILVSNYIALMTAFMGLYCISGFIMMFRVPNFELKILLMCFSLSPFILGHFAQYKTEKIFTFLQILIVVMSVITCVHFF